jgi:hypothetical protein
VNLPQPRISRADIQEQFIRNAQIPPENYYPEGYQPDLLEERPVDGELKADLEFETS